MYTIGPWEQYLTVLTGNDGDVVGIRVVQEIVDKVVLGLKAMKDIDVNARNKCQPTTCRLVHVI